MTKRFALVGMLALVGCAAISPSAAAKGLTASVQGATRSGLPHRYVAFAPTTPYKASSGGKSDRFTVVARIDRQGGRVGRWWYLPGQYSIPAAAYDDTVGGLSADGSTLVLSRFSWIYPPRTTGLAVIHTERQLRHPGGENRPRHAIDKLSLPGSFSFDAISPDGSTVYLIEHLNRVDGGPYRVRALDESSGKLRPGAIVDPEEPWEQMSGLPVSRVTSADGRWAYTLYAGYGGGRHDGRGSPGVRDPFVHALDTVAGRAACIDLPQLESGREPFAFSLAAGRNGRLVVFKRTREGGRREALLTVDTRSREVNRAQPVATASSGVGPWPPIAALGVITAALLTWIGVRNRRTADGGERMERL
ncbi:MAG TPA: hypothetical protein VF176_01040 [Solirubrobacterales bacterium]